MLSDPAPYIEKEMEMSESPEPLLTFEQVHAANTARCRRWHEDSTAWTGADWATALGGECGEALNVDQEAAPGRMRNGPRPERPTRS